MRIPFDLIAEYRGQAPAGEFTDRATGESIEYTPGLRFEVDLPDGDVDQWTFRQAKLDDVGSFDASKLEKGDKVHFTGSATLGSKQGERSFAQLSSAALVEAPKLAKATA